ncbi:MAG: acyl--CoA ligase [Gammaproteobacteria bacterium]|jgi:long-chain acyl-CoA synthetase|nr:acyl--CoA ligase [Gammaproteobacteria bacterium]
MNIMMLLEMAGGVFPDRPAFTDCSSGQSLTYAQLFEAARYRAASVRASGAERLVKLDVSNLGTPLSLFTSAWAGVPYVPLNYRLTDTEIEALLKRVTPAYLVTQAERAVRLGGLDGVLPVSSAAFLADNLHPHPVAEEWSMDPDEIAVLLFTSGTTGEPKAAVLRHKHLVAYILSSVEFACAEEQEAALVCVPPYHIAGIAAILSSVYSARHVIQLPNFTPQAWLEAARKYAVTTAFLVPTMLARIVDHLEGESTAGLPHLKNLSYGGGKMPLSVIHKAMQLLPDTDFSNAYGLTETSSTIAVLGPAEHRTAQASDDADVRRRLVSVGQPLPGVEIEIRNDQGEPLGPGERGEIYVRGEQVSGEYEGRGSATDADGWFATRDAGSIDEQGYLFLEGRADDVIVRGGENLSPGEIEDVLLAHPAVLDAAVVGVPDEQWGEGVAAALVARKGMQIDGVELQAYVKEQLRSSRVPQMIAVWDELPYNETGKLLRRVVKARLIDQSVD